MPTPIPAAREPDGRFEPSFAVVPFAVLLSLAGHGLVLAMVAVLATPPVQLDVASEPAVIVPFEPEAVLPEPVPEPVVEPPEPPPIVEPPPEPRVAAVVPRRRPRPAPPEVVPDPEPAPPAPVLTTETTGASAWSHPAGEPEGRLGGEEGGTGTGVAPGVVDAPPAEPGISRAELRRILARYITGTLSRYLDGRIDYPLAARREQLQGVVMLRIRLARDGRVLAVRLSRSSGHSILDRAALASVQGLGTMPAPPREIPWDDQQELPLPVTYVLQ